jgi:DNA-directed RNA polymerase alpha subunit
MLPGTVLDIPVGNLDISTRSKTILRQLRASTLREVVRLTERDIRTHNESNEMTVAEVKKALNEFGLTLRPAEPVKVGTP